MKAIDHIVITGASIETLSASWETLGFTPTPVAQHPWGTINRLIQLDGAFLELLSVAQGASIPKAHEGAFSFGAFNQAFLNKRQGPSMLVLDSSSPEKDRAAFEQGGLPVFEPFSFARIAKAPDGTERKVGFDLTFTQNPLCAEMGYFTCFNRYPENFWRPEYQQHANTAKKLSSVVLVAADPGDHHGFLKAFTGVGTANLSSLGVSIELSGATLKVLSPSAFESIHGYACPVEGRDMRLAHLEISVTSLDAFKRAAKTDGGYERGGAFVLPADQLLGTGLSIVGPRSA
ncbi:VOC family protein [Pseudovibrio exalbescens]|uniref:VOC family protein n=1 Tax=Pseudovibrio exalbescens TaxID=197461 RepID=UPI0023669E64|nr:VOC family protein [Pseudovibrio exalbescens]MDD7908600.1 VOC family protein [Pseudovibrio exalbescens]